MSETTGTPEEQDAATEAAQNVVDNVTSWEYSGDKEQISDKLDEGLREAGVEVPSQEKEQLVDQIDDLKDGENAGAPDVGSASPAE